MKIFTADFAGSDLSPICFRIDKRTLSFGFHNHTFWEFMFVERGSVLNTFDNHSKPLKKNELCILSPSTAHSVTNSSENEQYLLFNFEVKQEFVYQVCKTLGIEDPYFVLPSSYSQFTLDGSEISSCIQSLNQFQSLDLDSKKESLLRIIITKFIMLAIQRKDLPPQTQNHIVAKMLSELKNTENFHLSINELCEKVGYSHEYVTRLFKQEKLSPPNKIFLSNKLSYACNLFAHSQLSINEVASLCGIYSLSYFNKTFKALYGISPAVYKKQHETNKPNF